MCELSNRPVNLMIGRQHTLYPVRSKISLWATVGNFLMIVYFRGPFNNEQERTRLMEHVRRQVLDNLREKTTKPLQVVRMDEQG